MATSPKRAPPRRCSARACRSARRRAYLGHTLGACGALEAWFSIEMMNRAVRADAESGQHRSALRRARLHPRRSPADEQRLRDEQQFRVRRREHVAGVQALAHALGSWLASGITAANVSLAIERQRDSASGGQLLNTVAAISLTGVSMLRQVEIGRILSLVSVLNLLRGFRLYLT